jgi:hypothetical protein
LSIALFMRADGELVDRFNLNFPKNAKGSFTIGWKVPFSAQETEKQAGAAANRLRGHGTCGRPPPRFRASGVSLSARDWKMVPVPGWRRMQAGGVQMTF